MSRTAGRAPRPRAGPTARTGDAGPAAGAPGPPLEQRVRAALRVVREHDHALGLRLLEATATLPIVGRQGVETARIVRQGRRHRVELEPAFVAGLSDAELGVVLAHEAQHRTDGDLVRLVAGPRASRQERARQAFLENVAADCRINGRLHLVHRLPGAAPLLARLYAPDHPLGALLLPPDLLLASARGPGAEPRGRRERRPLDRHALAQDAQGACARDLARAFVAAGHAEEAAPALARWHLDAWLGRATLPALVDRLDALLAPGAEGLAAELVLLGDHGCEGDHADGEAGQGGELEARDVRPVAPRTRGLANVRQALLRALTATDRVSARSEARGPVPAWGRREAFLWAAGATPVLFPVTEDVPEEGRARVYVDVSGSTSDVQPLLAGLLLSLGALVRWPAHLFSTEVVDAGEATLRRGRLDSTGGTDFDCVLTHALAARARRILVVTDGLAPLDDDLAERARRARLEVFLLIVGNDHELCPLRPLARGTWTWQP